ncbi:hypothetical protein RFI_12540 [Reticulomyxa filosa]|uniref:Uncharacterized protein n=1 Tax=Reticulomyxa filosa TaxID=46433 RepID=X6NFT2_RETFI|nr:hypothetical protein RFI_12540 [Reticulomyxa filosa]|eukprot:ETO24614.1 hypothetical protein RFI_12540 [Reticulomyxa filosa]
MSDQITSSEDSERHEDHDQKKDRVKHRSKAAYQCKKRNKKRKKETAEKRDEEAIVKNMPRIYCHNKQLNKGCEYRDGEDYFSHRDAWIDTCQKKLEKKVLKNKSRQSYSYSSQYEHQVQYCDEYYVHPDYHNHLNSNQKHHSNGYKFLRDRDDDEKIGYEMEYEQTAIRSDEYVNACYSDQG